MNQQPETVAGTKDFMRKSLHWRRMKFRTTLLLPAIILGFTTEPFLREYLVKQNYLRIKDSKNGDLGERFAVFDLAGGCWAQKPYAWMPQYFRERIFGNCQLLDGTNLEKARLDFANLSGASLNFANLNGASLISANLSGANFYTTDLRGANLIGANLEGASFDLVNLSGANLIGANLKNIRFGCVYDTATGRTGCTNLKNIKWDKNTQWQGIQNWGDTTNIPPALKKQLGLP